MYNVCRNIFREMLMLMKIVSNTWHKKSTFSTVVCCMVMSIIFFFCGYDGID